MLVADDLAAGAAKRALALAPILARPILRRDPARPGRAHLAAKTACSTTWPRERMFGRDAAARSRRCAPKRFPFASTMDAPARHPALPSRFRPCCAVRSPMRTFSSRGLQRTTSWRASSASSGRSRSSPAARSRVCDEHAPHCRPALRAALAARLVRHGREIVGRYSRPMTIRMIRIRSTSPRPPLGQ